MNKISLNYPKQGFLWGINILLMERQVLIWNSMILLILLFSTYSFLFLIFWHISFNYVKNMSILALISKYNSSNIYNIEHISRLILWETLINMSREYCHSWLNTYWGVLTP